MDARLYLVTAKIEPVAAAIEGGVEIVQLRDKESDDDGFLRAARELVSICRPRGVPVILNDRVHLVAAAGADGAHVGEADLEPERAREILGPDSLLGVSTHDRAELAAARGRGRTYSTGARSTRSCRTTRRE